MSERYNAGSGSGGFTLIEVLVSVVIFSVGLLGLAGLQATGLKLNQSSMLRSQATLLTYDILDAIRANRGQLANYALGGSSSGCDVPYSSPSNQAQRDVNNWINNVNSLLPDPRNCSITPMGGNQVQVNLEWNDLRDADMPAKRITLETDL